MTNRSTPNYLPGTRVVSFMDIIGFSALIDSITNDQEDSQYKYGLIVRVLSEKSRRQDRNRERFSEEALHLNGLTRPSMDGAVFSDSIVVSSPIHERIGFSENFVIEETVDMATHLLSEGIFVRGGIARGWCYHNNNIVFGKGMINACDLEKYNAIVPRILVTDDIVEDLRKYSNEFVEIILSRDTDGLWFVNLFNNLLAWVTIEPDYFESEQVKSAKRHIINGLKQSEKSGYKIKAKYRWLATQYNLSIDRFNEDNVLRNYGISKISF